MRQHDAGQVETGLHCLRIDHILHAIDQLQPAIPEQGNAVCIQRGQVQVVHDGDDRDIAFLCPLPGDAEYPVLLARIECSGGFIQQ